MLRPWEHRSGSQTPDKQTAVLFQQRRLPIHLAVDKG